MITLIHPSRGRAKKAKETFENWCDKANGKEFQYILSIDLDDTQLNEYDSLFEGEIVVRAHNKSVVEATNIAAKYCEGNILVYLSDDFDCPSNWVELIEKNILLDKPQLLKVHDCLQPFEVRVLTIPIMNRMLYDWLGYFFNPEYKSMFCDQHLYEICAKNNFLVFNKSLEFPHLHCSIGKAQNDETYRRSSANWDQGKSVYERHLREGFKR